MEMMKLVVQCSGSEISLKLCDYDKEQVRPCYSSEKAAVKCGSKGKIISKNINRLTDGRTDKLIRWTG